MKKQGLRQELERNINKIKVEGEWLGLEFLTRSPFSLIETFSDELVEKIRENPSSYSNGFKVTTIEKCELLKCNLMTLMHYIKLKQVRQFHRTFTQWMDSEQHYSRA